MPLPELSGSRSLQWQINTARLWRLMVGSRDLPVFRGKNAIEQSKSLNPQTPIVEHPTMMGDALSLSLVAGTSLITKSIAPWGAKSTSARWTHCDKAGNASVMVTQKAKKCHAKQKQKQKQKKKTPPRK